MNLCLHTRLILWGFSFLFPISLFAQAFIPPSSKPETRWGVVTPEDLGMKTYKLDPEAAAVVLWDHGDWIPENWEKGRVRLFRHVRIKILKEEGLKYAKQQISYKQGEKLGGFRAQTINWDVGKNKEAITKLDLKSLGPDKAVGESFTRSFEFPDVRVGSVIEYRYSLVAPEFDELKPWYFQSEIPTRWSEVQTRGFQPYQHRSIATGLDIKPLRRGVWRAKFLAAFPKEPFADNPEQFRAGIRFFLIPGNSQATRKKGLEESWRNIRERLHYNTYLDPDEQALQALYAVSQDLVKDAITEEEKISIIHKHLGKYVKWNGQYELWVKKNPAQVYKSHTGNGTEVNMLLLYMLDMAGLEVEQAFVSTRSHGKLVKAPIYNQFNHVVCRVKLPSSYVFVDATEPLAPYDLPPIEVVNGAAFIFKDTSTHIVGMPPSDQTRSLWMVQADLSLPQIKLEIKESHSGYAGLARRKLLTQSPNEILARGDTFRPFLHASFERPQIAQEKNAELPLELLHENTLPSKDYLTQEGDSLYLSSLICFQTKSPFPAMERKLPVDLRHPRSYSFLINYTTPEGYKIARTPKTLQMSLSGKSLVYNFQVSAIGDVVSVQTRFEVTKPTIFPEEYDALREFYQKMVAKELEPIVFVKK